MFIITILLTTWCLFGGLSSAYHYSDDMSPWKHWTIKQKVVMVILYGPIVWLSMLLTVIVLCVEWLYDTYADKWVTEFWNWLGDKK